ncbi:MAG: alpha-2-macroglobulin [Bacteroidetes bacterium]|nr:MAG: alpha-2-macroglobulin [Bacteroidota bacterium]
MNKPILKFSLLFTILFALLTNATGQQPGQIDKRWMKVDQLVDKGLPKSALVEVRKIYTLAKKEKLDVQVIKSLLYMIRLQDQNRESAKDSSIREMEKELAISQEPATSILSSLLADLYLNYYQNVRWTLYSRTQTVNFKKNDIATWGTEDFHKKIAELYLRSIKNEKLLQQTRLQPFDAIIEKGNVRHLRPTLYDLLAHRALPYFENDERDLKKPAYAFEIDQASAFDPAADFVTVKFITKDSLSLQHKALLIYQKLIAFHLKDSKPDALIDVDLQRLAFVNEKSVHPDKNKLYFNAINHVAHQYDNLPAADQAWYLVANYYEEKSREYKPYGDSTHRLDRVKAKEICERIIARRGVKDSSEGKINCYNLLRQISSLSLRFTIEKVNLPEQPFRAAVSYRNFNKVYLRLVKADSKLTKELENEDNEDYWKKIFAAKTFRSWEQSLPVTNDMQDHLVEIKVEALPVGEYMLVASTDKDFSNIYAKAAARLFYVSSISFVNNNQDFFVLNRDNGQPLANAKVQVWENVYDPKTSSEIKVKNRLYKTDNNGFFRMEKKKDNENYNNVFLDITYNNDHLFLDDQVGYYYGYNEESPPPPPLPNGEKEIDRNTATYLFTDRSIYRPGQTLFFKGISIVTSKENKRSIRDDYKTWIYLLNANSEKQDSLQVQTNEYGTFSGKFQLPSGVLNGQFMLQMKYNRGMQSIRVEEYKRPKFYVDYEPLKGTYRFNDKIKITGVAKAYAGNNIDGATVQYRVVRYARFLYSWVSWKWWQPASPQMEIAHGTTKTDKEGKFIVEFTAIPDLAIDKKFDPVFDYMVYGDVTDINGETRSGEQTVSVSYKALILTVDIPRSLSLDSLKNISVRTENMNHEFEPARVTVSLTKLKEEKRLIRGRYWERPDQFIMSKEEYIRNFPHDKYDNEGEWENLEKEGKVLEKTDSTRENSKFEIGNPITNGTKLEPGVYMVEISTRDKNGEEVKDIKYVELIDEKSMQVNPGNYIWTEAPKAIEPGETTNIKIGSAADDLFVIQQTEKQSGAGSTQLGVISYSFMKLNNEKKVIDFTATEADRGGFGVTYLFVKHNGVYQSTHTIIVPWTNKDLRIEYESFRDKTLPGSEEKWKIKLTGYKNEKVAAEMLAGMYDASLEQFYPHYWYTPGIWPSFYSNRTWNGEQNFAPLESRPKEMVDTGWKYVYKEYDELNEQGDRNRKILRAGSWQDFGNYRRGNVTYYYGDLNVSAAQVKKIAGNGDNNMLYGKVSGLEINQGIGTFSLAATPSVGISSSYTTSPQPQGKEVQVRKNFNETAFFFPDLRTDSSGAIEFSFTMPEALTKWRFMAFAHTKDLAFGYSTKDIVTQKQLMVQPNAPRFLREGDKLELSAKVVNLTENEITGQAELQLFDATTNQPVDGRFKNTIPNQYFTVAPGQSEAIKFPIEVPFQFNKPLTWKIVAKASPAGGGLEGAMSDGEENALPVLTNRMLVTETMPLNMRGTATKSFKFDKLINSGNSESLQNHSLVVEYTSNPSWYAVQALPYLIEYPYECAEQTWNRYYANSLAMMISNSSPRVKQIFEQWKTTDSSALLSNLQKNEELKSVLLEETPWVLEAKTEAEQKRNIALLFDMVKMSGQLTSTYEQLKQMQLSNGGFVWFKGGPDDRYITQYIVSAIGHLKKLKAIADGQDSKLKAVLNTAIPYLDRKMVEDYAELVKHKYDLKTYVPGHFIVQYLYMRSFFPEYKMPAASQAAYDYFRTRAQKTWTQQSKYMQGMLVLALGRTGDAVTPAAMLKSLKETSINNDELGMYWKDANRGWWWFEAPLERQALLIEAFQEIGKDMKTVDDMKTWLLKNKQTNNWESTRATAEACYALLLQGSPWLSNEPVVQIRLGNTTGSRHWLFQKEYRR